MRLIRCRECVYGDRYGGDIVACKLHAFTSYCDGFCHDGVKDFHSQDNAQIVDDECGEEEGVWLDPDEVE